MSEVCLWVCCFYLHPGYSYLSVVSVNLTPCISDARERRALEMCERNENHVVPLAHHRSVGYDSRTEILRSVPIPVACMLSRKLLKSIQTVDLPSRNQSHDKERAGVQQKMRRYDYDHGSLPGKLSVQADARNPISCVKRPSSDLNQETRH